MRPRSRPDLDRVDPDAHSGDLYERVDAVERDLRALLAYARVIAAVLGLNVGGHALDWMR